MYFVLASTHVMFYQDGAWMYEEHFFCCFISRYHSTGTFVMSILVAIIYHSPALDKCVTLSFEVFGLTQIMIEAEFLRHWAKSLPNYDYR